MSEVGHETRSTIILFIAILMAVIITVWLILSFDKPNNRDNRGRQTGSFAPAHNNNYSLVSQIENNFS